MTVTTTMSMSRPAQAQQRMHWFSLLLSLALLLAVSGVDAKDPKTKECIEISRGKELKKYLAENHVLVSLQKASKDGDDDANDDDDSDDEDKEYKDICERFKSTPIERIKDMEIAKVTDSNLRKQVLAKAKPPKPSRMDQLKQLVGLMPKDDPDKAASYPEYVLFQKGDMNEGVRFMGMDEEKTANAISDFLSTQLQRKKIGSFVYSLGTFDLIVAHVMKKEGWEQKAWAYTGKALSLLQSWHPSRGSDPSGSAELGELYIKTCFKIMEASDDPSKDNEVYVKNQIKRLEGMLESDGDKIGPLKKEELQQRVYTLKRFTEPVPYTDEDVRSFVIHTALNIGVWIILMIMLPVMLFTSVELVYDDDEEGVEDDDEKKEGDDEKKKE